MQGIKYRSRFLKKSGGSTMQDMEGAGSAHTSETIEMKGDTLWGIQVVHDMDSAATVTVLHSIDGTNFVPYSSDTIDVDLTEDANQILVDNHCIAPYLQFKFDFTGSTTGTFSVHFLEKEIL